MSREWVISHIEIIHIDAIVATNWSEQRLGKRYEPPIRIPMAQRTHCIVKSVNTQSLRKQAVASGYISLLNLRLRNFWFRFLSSCVCERNIRVLLLHPVCEWKLYTQVFCRRIRQRISHQAERCCALVTFWSSRREPRRKWREWDNLHVLVTQEHFRTFFPQKITYGGGHFLSKKKTRQSAIVCALAVDLPMKTTVKLLSFWLRK